MNIWEKIKVMTSAVWDFLQPIVKILITETGKVLMQIAIDVVKSLATNTTMSGSEKRDAAFKLISSELETKGMQVGVSVTNLAIEMAYAKLKNM